MGRKTVFLDRDGTINVDRGFVHDRSGFEYIRGAREGLRILQEGGYQLVVVTNQSGIARGLYTEADFEALTAWMLEDLESAGVSIAGVYHCPHHPEVTGACACRKPAVGLFMQAAGDLDVDFGRSWAVGDKPRDLAVCEATPCRGILLSAGGDAGGEAEKYMSAGSLLEAARLIVKEQE